MLNGQRQVPIQEAVHILDNQELVICSDRITYVSLAQGQALWSETDRSKQKDLITVYRNQNKEHYPISLEQYFYCVFVDSTFKKQEENKKTDSNRNNNHQSKQNMEEPKKEKNRSKTITKPKSIRPNRYQLNSYVEPYHSLQGQHLNFLNRVENNVGISITSLITPPNLTVTVLHGAPVWDETQSTLSGASRARWR